MFISPSDASEDFVSVLDRLGMAPKHAPSALETAGTQFIEALCDYELVADNPKASASMRSKTLNVAIDRAVSFNSALGRTFTPPRTLSDFIFQQGIVGPFSDSLSIPSQKDVKEGLYRLRDLVNTAKSSHHFAPPQSHMTAIHNALSAYEARRDAAAKKTDARRAKKVCFSLCHLWVCLPTVLFRTSKPPPSLILTTSLKMARVCWNKSSIIPPLTRYLSSEMMWLVKKLVGLQMDAEKAESPNPTSGTAPILAAAHGTDTRAGSGSVPKELHFGKKPAGEKVYFLFSPRTFLTVASGTGLRLLQFHLSHHAKLLAQARSG